MKTHERAIRGHGATGFRIGGDSMSTDTETAAGTESGAVAKMTLPTLTAMVVGGMVGAGVF